MAENLSGALLLAQAICWDESHGYNRNPGSRELNPDTDCSYFIGYCLAQNGFNVNPNWYTGSMITDLQAYPGFTEYIWSTSFQWQNGDIAVYDEGGGAHGHAFFYSENVRGYLGTDGDTCDGSTGNLLRARIEASNDRGHSQPGDQDNGYGAHSEVWVHAYSDPSSNHTWHVFRWQDSPVPPLTLEQQITIYSARRRKKQTYEGIRRKIFY